MIPEPEFEPVHIICMPRVHSACIYNLFVTNVMFMHACILLWLWMYVLPTCIYRVKVSVTPTSREVFQYALMLVPGNENWHNTTAIAESIRNLTPLTVVTVMRAAQQPAGRLSDACRVRASCSKCLLIDSKGRQIFHHIYHWHYSSNQAAVSSSAHSSPLCIFLFAVDYCCYQAKCYVLNEWTSCWMNEWITVIYQHRHTSKYFYLQWDCYFILARLKRVGWLFYNKPPCIYFLLFFNYFAFCFVFIHSCHMSIHM
jgi:hypothetical protein